MQVSKEAIEHSKIIKKIVYSIDRYHSLAKVIQCYLYFDSLQFLLYHSLQIENKLRQQAFFINEAFFALSSQTFSVSTFTEA